MLHLCGKEVQGREEEWGLVGWGCAGRAGKPQAISTQASMLVLVLVEQNELPSVGCKRASSRRICACAAYLSVTLHIRRALGQQLLAFSSVQGSPPLWQRAGHGKGAPLQRRLHPLRRQPRQKRCRQLPAAQDGQGMLPRVDSSTT